MKKSLFLSLIITAAFSLVPSLSAEAACPLAGRIVLQVQSKGEAWYINPVNKQRYYIGRSADAFKVIQKNALGVSNKDFDSFKGKAPARLSGRILLKVEDKGKAYYVNPCDLKIYYLSSSGDILKALRAVGLGIRNIDLNKIPCAYGPCTEQVISENGIKTEFNQLETKVHEYINMERKNRGLTGLKWNSDVAKVARSHSSYLAQKNLNERTPSIQHEGADGKYQDSRLEAAGIHYFNMSGENIALLSESNMTDDQIAKKVVDMWMGSEGHRENILRDYNEEGIGIVKVNDYYIVTENFIRRIEN